MEVASAEPDEFYDNAKQYWQSIPPTIDGMLGGFSDLSVIDAQASCRFIQLLMKDNIRSPDSYVLDCGSGIGRVTKTVLSKFFASIDLVEQCQEFLNRAREYLGPEISEKVKNLYCSGLQDFKPEANKYDIIWNQWVLGHLKDAALVDYLKRSKEALKSNGYIVVKENIASTESIDVDDVDSSVTRPRSLLLSVFQEAGLIIVKEKLQTRFPAGMYEVRMFALQ